jgi:hypothetical protein
MAHELNKVSLPKIAASAVGAHLAVQHSASSPDQVVLSTVNTGHPVGLTVATAATAGNPVAVYAQGVVKAVCAASVGNGAEVGVASTNGALGPVSAASGVRRFAVGISQGPAAAGETFSVLLRIRELPGLAV